MKFKDFEFELKEETKLLVQVTYFTDSLFIYIADKFLTMNNAYLTIQTKYV